MPRLGVTAAVLLFILAIASGALYDSLKSIQYLNEGVDYASNLYTIQPHGGLFYTEPQNITSGWGVSWDDSTLYYPYLVNKTTLPVKSCAALAPITGDRQGGDMATVQLSSLNATECGALCCGLQGCLAYVLAIAPGPFMSCLTGKPCCYLKSTVPPISPNQNILNGLVDRPEPGLLTPPVGIRSANPLGGVSCGSIELRTDGTFHEWTIINQSPGGSPKFGVVDDAVMAVRVQGSTGSSSKASLVRTRPQYDLPGVQGLRYRGSFPVTRLDILDDTFPVELSVYGFSVFKPGDLNRSVTPAIMFSLNAFNPTEETQLVSFMLSLPFSNEPDTVRSPINPKNVLKVISVPSPAECLHACDNLQGCASWSLTYGNCTLQADVPPNNYHLGSFSGVSGKWSGQQTKPSKGDGAGSYVAPTLLNLNRPGYGPMFGNISLWAVGESQDGSPIQFSSSVGNSDDLPTLFGQFEGTGTLAGVIPSAINGATTITAALPPGKKATLSIIFSWYFPYRDHVGPKSPKPTDALIIGNWYSNLFNSSAAVASKLTSDLTTVVDDIAAMHSLYFGSSMSDPLKDYLVNGMSHIRSAIYTTDGTWRQWEAYDCDDIDSVHNDYQRHIPYILYFPETEKQKLRAHAMTQQADGMVQEELSGGGLGPTPPWETPSTRIMADVSTLFTAQVWQFYSWSNDVAFLKEMYPHVRAATLWQIGVSPQGLPEHLVNTYDILNLASYPLCTFNSALHLMAMRAAVQLANAVGDFNLSRLAQQSFANGSRLIDSALWYDNPGGIGYYQSYNGAPEHAVMADALYGQVVAYTLGLGPILPIPKMRSHLLAELAYNDGPFGLIVQTGREPPTNKQDNAIWMGGSQDWSALALRVFDDVSIADLMAPSDKALNHIRKGLRDEWNTHGLVASDGYTDLQGGLPLCTAHYGFHMVLWHIPFSLSGQTAYMMAGVLTFDPVVSVPYSLPVLLPTVLGTLEADYAESGIVRYTLSLVFGSLSVKTLRVSSSTVEGGVTLTAGQQVTWTQQDAPVISVRSKVIDK